VNEPIEPSDIGPPAANYVHAMVTSPGSRTLHTSGVVPIRPDGSVPEHLAEQAEVVWSNIAAMLRDADMTASDIVSVVTYAVQGEDLGVIMAARDSALAGHRAASTLVLVSALAQPTWKFEIAIVAAVS